MTTHNKEIFFFKNKILTFIFKVNFFFCTYLLFAFYKIYAGPLINYHSTTPIPPTTLIPFNSDLKQKISLTNGIGPLDLYSSLSPSEKQLEEWSTNNHLNEQEHLSTSTNKRKNERAIEQVLHHGIPEPMFDKAYEIIKQETLLEKNDLEKTKNHTKATTDSICQETKRVIASAHYTLNHMFNKLKSEINSLFKTVYSEEPDFLDATWELLEEFYIEKTINTIDIFIAESQQTCTGFCEKIDEINKERIEKTFAKFQLKEDASENPDHDVLNIKLNEIFTYLGSVYDTGKLTKKYNKVYRLLKKDVNSFYEKMHDAAITSLDKETLDDKYIKEMELMETIRVFKHKYKKVFAGTRKIKDFLERLPTNTRILEKKKIRMQRNLSIIDSLVKKIKFTIKVLPYQLLAGGRTLDSLHL